MSEALSVLLAAGPLDVTGPGIGALDLGRALLDLGQNPLYSTHTFYPLGISLVLGEYRGYGRSAGSPSERSLTDDFVALYDTVAARSDVDAQRLLFHGRSVGGGVVCAAARLRPPAALILESTFTSVADVARSLWVPGFLLRDRFDNHAALTQLRAPVLLMHGKHDQTIQLQHSHQLAAATPNAVQIVYDCGHNDLPPSPRQYWRDIEKFLRDAAVIPRALP